MKNIWFFIISLLFCVALALGCSEECEECDGAEGDDASENDSDDRPECEINSGWPCTCEMTTQGVECEDGESYCISLVGTAIGYGWCAATASSLGGACPFTDYWGTGAGSVNGENLGVTALCVLECTEHTDCPPDQMCRPVQENAPPICMP